MFRGGSKASVLKTSAPDHDGFKTKMMKRRRRGNLHYFRRTEREKDKNKQKKKG